MAERARYYVDTSAYLAVLLGERDGEAIERAVAGAEVVSSVLLVLETTRNLIRMSRSGELAADRLRACLDRMDHDLVFFELRDLTLELCRSLVMPIVSTPRSLDLAHLRTALACHADRPLTRLITLDAELRRSAQEMGLPV